MRVAFLRKNLGQQTAAFASLGCLPLIVLVRPAAGLRRMVAAILVSFAASAVGLCRAAVLFCVFAVVMRQRHELRVVIFVPRFHSLGFEEFSHSVGL